MEGEGVGRGSGGGKLYTSFRKTFQGPKSYLSKEISTLRGRSPSTFSTSEIKILNPLQPKKRGTP